MLHFNFFAHVETKNTPGRRTQRNDYHKLFLLSILCLSLGLIVNPSFSLDLVSTRNLLKLQEHSLVRAASVKSWKDGFFSNSRDFVFRHSISRLVKRFLFLSSILSILDRDYNLNSRDSFLGNVASPGSNVPTFSLMQLKCFIKAVTVVRVYCACWDRLQVGNSPLGIPKTMETYGRYGL